MSKTPPTVIAAIPCFRTSPHIADVVSRTREHVHQVIVIDDGSDDGTAEAARAAGALVMNHDQNRGYGEAVKSSFEAARENGADVLVILDGDGQHSPDEIPRVLSPILSGHADLVIGSRFLPHFHALTADFRLQTTDSRLLVMPRYRRFGIRVITLLWNFGSGVKVSDSQSGFRAYSKNLLDSLSLSEKGMALSIEILEKARRERAVIKEVPITCSYVPHGLNRRATRHGLGIALSVLRIRLRHSLVRDDND